MIPIMRACSDPGFRRIVVVCGAQMGKTEALFNVIGHRLDDDPAPTLYIGPTQKQVESVSSDRVMKLFKSVPSLWNKLAKGQRNKISEKFIGGVRLGFGWAGSATELSSHPAGLVLVDERDRMTDDVEGEGDPVALADARTATYPDGKVIVVSTPTIEGGSPIWSLFEEGTQHEWAWPCPDCGDYFIPKLELLQWPEKATPQQALKEARLACPHCGSLIEDRHKAEMNVNGRFMAPGQIITPDGGVCGDIPETDTASFRVSGLCSPWRSFGQRAKAFIEATRSGVSGRVQAVVNTGFGELYQMKGEAPDWQQVMECAAGYESGTSPEGVRIITAGVDVQKDRLVYVVRGWGVAMESWLIEHGELWGDTQYPQVWQDLGNLLDRQYGDLRIRRMTVDSGFRKDQVYQFCRQYKGRAYPSKGHDRLDRPYYASKVDVSWRGKTIKNGIDLWHFDSDQMKSWIHARVEWPEDQPGAWHLPSDVTEDYCQQIVAEQRLVKASGRVQWIQTRKDNHYLDAEALNTLSAMVLNVEMLRDKSEEKDNSAQEKSKASEFQVAPRRPRNNWVNKGFGRPDWYR